MAAGPTPGPPPPQHLHPKDRSTQGTWSPGRDAALKLALVQQEVGGGGEHPQPPVHATLYPDSTRGRWEDTAGAAGAAPLHNPALFTPLYKTAFPHFYFTKPPPALGEGRGERGNPATGEHLAAHPSHRHPISPLPGPWGGWQRRGEPRQGECSPPSHGEPGDGVGGFSPTVVVWHQIPLPPAHPACSSQPRSLSCDGYCHGGIINRLSE